MLKVGITGGIGSGKTTVCSLFELLNIPVYYADARAKQLMTSSVPLKAKIKGLLGKEAYYRNGRLNRSYVASKVFSNKKLLEDLNNIVHPAVGQDYLDWHNSQNNVPYTLKEAALLVENGSYKELDTLVVVTASRELRVERVMKRDDVTREQVLSRMENQLSQEDKIKVADYIVDNSGKESIISQVLEIHNNLLSLKEVD